MPVIIAGKRKGAKLLVPEGEGVRPTLNRVREALFSILYSEFGTFEDCCVLDPFAGAGMLGLEAWSRGAAHVDMMEISKPHFDILKKNIAKLQAAAEVHACLGQSPQDWHHFAGRKYDLVLCDPPYASGLMPQTLQTLVSGHYLRSGAIITVELNAADNLEIPQELEIIKTRKYGKCQLVLIQQRADSSPQNESL